MIFKPTGTSQVLIKAVKEIIKKPKILDLGCGCGEVGISLLDLGEVFASDIDQEAVDSIDTAKNGIDARCGNLFEPWVDMEFDIIVDDVSGVAEDVAKISPWFEGVPCETGSDGTKLVCEVLKQAPNYLLPNGKLFFPIVSFSDINKILGVANENFLIEQLSHTEFPLPKEMYKHRDLLNKLKAEGKIHFEEKFGMIIYWTDIYVAYN